MQSEQVESCKKCGGRRRHISRDTEKIKSAYVLDQGQPPDTDLINAVVESRFRYTTRVEVGFVHDGIQYAGNGCLVQN